MSATSGHDARAGPAAGLRSRRPTAMRTPCPSYKKYAMTARTRGPRPRRAPPPAELESSACSARIRAPASGNWTSGTTSPPSSRTLALPRRSGDRERAPLPGGPAAGRPRRADRAAQPPLLPRDPRARGARAHRYNRRSRSSSSTSTTSRQSTTGSAISPATPCSPKRPSASATVVRGADIPCRVGGDEFAVILRSRGSSHADQLYRRIQGAVSCRPIGHAGNSFSAGVAELGPRTSGRALPARRRGALPRERRGESARLPRHRP